LGGNRRIHKDRDSAPTVGAWEKAFNHAAVVPVWLICIKLNKPVLEGEFKRNVPWQPRQKVENDPELLETLDATLFQ
jgi:hypothetical protein